MPNRWMALVECLWWGGILHRCARQAGFFDVTHGQQQEIEMNQDRFAGTGKQFRGKVKEHWGKLTNGPLGVAAGTRDQFAGRIQERYGIYKEKAERWCCGATRRAKRNRIWNFSNR